MLNTGGNGLIEQCDIFAGKHGRLLLHADI
jgi:hypothetical protein